MKITSVDVMVLHPRGTGNTWRPVVCRVNTDQGIHGYGEAAMAYGIGSSGAFGMVKDLAGLVIGMDPLANEVIWDKLYKESFWGQNGGVTVFAGISAIDVALWDIKGKYFDVPVHQLLGGKRRDRLRSYASQLQLGWGQEFGRAGRTADYVDACDRAAAEGYDAVKIDFLTFSREGVRFRPEQGTRLLGPATLDLVEERIAAARETLGAGRDLIVEAHSFTDVASAIQIGKRAEKYGIFYYEEPTTPHPRLHKRVAEAVDIPLASGERIVGRWDYAPYLEEGILGVIQPDLGTCGGLTEAKKICDMAATYDVGVQAHVCGTPLSTAAALQIESVLPNFTIHEHHVANRTPWNKELCVHDYQPVNGYISVPDLPGIGNELSDFALETAHIESVTESREWL
ncbi:mandelate racemase/muconate lactonizing enzyme family protein [Amycolatopsis sp. NBC_01480]|uniref:mandelate racemase/muconate lactonizing enzyme family protein n=1 Tax=Amycolatopsis sp. NBC_01480 TaxID=2903562 RepID=UPI002E2E2D72|nr:mandelate racemase/muconate lactonizing enzyme family protein [Amycolatopsis sp. NBC_01480]